MSGRNNRMVRNRERSSQFSLNPVVCKMILIVMVFGVFAFGFWEFWKNKNAKKTICLAEGSKISYEYFVLSNEEAVGVIDKKGNQILETKYTNVDIPNPAKDVFIAYLDDKCEVFNRNGEKIGTDFEQVEAIKSSEDTNEMETQALKYKKGNLYGLLDLDGNILTEAIYDEIVSLDYRPGRILVKKDNQYGVLDAKANVVIEVNYDQIVADGYWSDREFYERTGYIVGKKKEDGIQFGYINYEGNVLFDTKFESLERALEYDDEENIYLIAMQKGKKGVFKNKKKLMDCHFQDIKYSNLSKVFIVNKNGKYGFYNQKGNVILKPEYSKYSMAGNYISVTKDDETQLFDIHGNLVNTASFQKMIETENPSYFIAEDDEGYYSIISKDVKIDEKYIQVSYAFRNYFIFTDKSGKTGVINALTKEVEIEPDYDFILLIEGTNSLQAIDGVKNVVDIYSKDLRKTVTMEDGVVEHIDGEYSIVYSGTDMKYINSDGEIVPNTEVYPDKKMYATKQNDKWGFADSAQNIVIPCEYDIVTEFNEYGFAGIQKDGKWGVVNEEGQVIVEPTYELDTYYFPQFIGKYQLIQSEITYCEEV